MLGMALTLGGILWVIQASDHRLVPHAEGSVLSGVLSGVLGALGQAVGFVISKLALRSGLDPLSATVVRVKDGQLLTTDGPFAEGKEHIGGFSIIKAADLDVALEWGAKLARATTLPIEVRPFHGNGSADV